MPVKIGVMLGRFYTQLHKPMIIRVIVYFVYTMTISIMSDETWFVLIRVAS